jgi:hypothetical protein
VKYFEFTVADEQGKRTFSGLTPDEAAIIDATIKAAEETASDCVQPTLAIGD